MSDGGRRDESMRNRNLAALLFGLLIFTGPIQSLNETTVSYPGSVRTRFSNRKPQSYMYAPFSPVLHYNALQGDFVGGNFWDMRASGYRLQNPSAEQAQGPPTNP